MQVAALLESRHGGGRYRVYNLCVERGYGDPQLFGGRVVRLPLYDGQVGARSGRGGGDVRVRLQDR